MAPTLSELRVALSRLEKPLRDKGITSLALFGSLIRGEAGPRSDIDILIDVDPAAHFSLFDLVSLKSYIEDQLQREVDVVTRDGLDPHVRDQVLYEAESVF